MHFFLPFFSPVRAQKVAELLLLPCCITVFFGLWLRPIHSSPESQSTPISFQGSVKNMTSGKYVSASELKLILLEQGMKVVETIHPSTSSFRFSPLVPKKAPYLIQAVFAQENYSKLIPPNPSLWKKKQIIHVYESELSKRIYKLLQQCGLLKRGDFYL